MSAGSKREKKAKRGGNKVTLPRGPRVSDTEFILNVNDKPQLQVRVRARALDACGGMGLLGCIWWVQIHGGGRV